MDYQAGEQENQFLQALDALILDDTNTETGESGQTEVPTAGLGDLPRRSGRVIRPTWKVVESRPEPPTTHIEAPPTLARRVVLLAPFVVHETNSVSRELTKESLRPFLISQTAARTSHPTNTPLYLKSRKRSRISFPHTQTSPPSFLTTTSGRQVQPNHDATEMPLRNCSLERISRQVTSRG